MYAFLLQWFISGAEKAVAASSGAADEGATAGRKVNKLCRVSLGAVLFA